MKGWALSESPKEECGVVGVYDPHGEAARTIFFALFALQHRGQESAGIAVYDGASIHSVKEMGLVSQVFDERTISELPGHFGIGHTRYSTTGSSVVRNAQPIFCQTELGELAVAHNGNLVNALALRKELQSKGVEFLGTSDSEIIAWLFAEKLDEGIEEAVRHVLTQARGAYSVTVLLKDLVIGFRDPWGVRPLVAGSIGGSGFMVASESCAFGPLAGRELREIEPGEMVRISESGMETKRIAEAQRRSLCLFEFIYFARPDSHMDGTLLYDARYRMGEQLAREHPAPGADIVVPVPDSGVPAALGFSKESGIPYQEAMVKSRYIHRTFIQPDQRMREMGVRMKLTPLEEHIRGKSLVLVDDSIVRATTTKQIVKMLFESGAQEVHVRITAPPIRFPCFYGIDMARGQELAAARMSVDQVCGHVGATSLGYLSIRGCVASVRSKTGGFCLACFSGDYPIEVPEAVHKHQLETEEPEPPEALPRQPALFGTESQE